QPLFNAFPDAPSAEAFRLMANELTQWEIAAEPAGVEQFLQQLVHLNQKLRPAGKRPVLPRSSLAR
ncbi:MAG TPA: hypothetical protein VFH22_06120, partial [Rhodocyclaceae bacterium]|nr:hypothetical protein [Rhodocyclaceae bacterium]